ncbi:hypothetical protein JZO77_03515 [Enterococcus hulanensis]|uniref:hypothetical protein n=1 Tax=Enterococcus hulanensis TaxID=2559929 RepID=UPI001A8D897C|nr:hypothetical protein [Enterococcus hulanensis]MBO0455807.1 hypothetical protein [Enterococcus hulanensis]
MTPIILNIIQAFDEVTLLRKAIQTDSYNYLNRRCGDPKTADQVIQQLENFLLNNGRCPGCFTNVKYEISSVNCEECSDRAEERFDEYQALLAAMDYEALDEFYLDRKMRNLFN